MSQLTHLLAATHRKAEFSCGKEILDGYLHRQASQDVKRKLTACFILEDRASGLIQGYYTLSNNSIPLSVVPAYLQQKLPKSYTFLPTTLLGRLAIDHRYQGQGTGKLLLVDALQRSYEISKTIGSFAVVVDPLDQEAENFYLKYGFIKLPDSGKMFLAMQTIKSLFE
ncbi:GNAT family N-acetyltransferase [Rufibacter sp. XAAS-G3-1]|uniref:GNAT family N-acetyltransferase n=1 Tax=Rufibacter sp. XAAS-G3-1 TaxID=2729134 RepID=UPI0015E64193|nr:GNAT family N-acetyltransferase [Rufibacter sp. XAAS-G3-1]